MAANSYRSFHLPESTPHYPPSKDFHTEHASIELSLDFEKKRIAGSCALTIVPIRKGLPRISLDAVGFEISDVTLDGTECDYDYDLEHLVVRSPGPLNGSHVVKVSYSSTPAEGIYFTGPEPEFPHKEVQAWTHGEAEFSRYWFPCHDHPNDKFTSEIRLTVPKGFRVISNGALVETKESGDNVTYHWKERLAHPSYLTSFVAGRFGELAQESEGVKLHYYFPKHKEPDVLRYFGETPKMIKVFNELTGFPYPYPKYDQTTVEDFIFGGMENFNATTLAMNYYPDGASEEDFATSYAAPHRNPVNLVAHELAHQWFGDLVTCVEWSHAWLNEAFATYMQSMYIERSRGVDDFRKDLEARADDYFEEDKSDYRRPIVDKDYVYPDDVFDMTTYEKGAWMIHELRYVIGDEAFFDGVSQYLKSFAFKNAETSDFRKTMEDVSGLSLEEFFEQAFFRPGFPEFQIDYKWDEESRLATVTVRQVQKLEAGTPVFKLPCDLVFYVQGKRIGRRVMLNTAEQSFSFGFESKPSMVELDPERWLLKKVRFAKGTDLLINQLEGSADASSRAEAAKSLGELKANMAVGALKRAALKEQFWDVRSSALRALGEIGSDEALAAILEVGMPSDRRVRRAVTGALGNFKGEKARGLLVELLEKDASPFVRCEAALALAKAWPEGAFDHLREAMTVHSVNEVITEACLDSMGKLKDERIGGIIRENLAYGKPPRVRIGALNAIAGRGHILDEEVPVLKQILLKDREFRVRFHLVSKVIPTLGDRRLIDAVKESSTTDKDPRVRRKALEVYYELSASAEVSGTITKLKDEVERLKEQNALLVRGQPSSSSA
jgi:aminopeptidase N